LAYKLKLPEELAGIHPVFHVSQQGKCLRVPDETILPEAVDLQETLEYVEYPVKILARVDKETRRTTIPYCKVLRSNHTEQEATWEKESDLKERCPHLFEDKVNL
jgi:hypothetical protein